MIGVGTSMNIDITDQIKFNAYDVDGESLPIQRCVCGRSFDFWDFVISIYDDDPHECPECGRKMFFRVVARIYEVVR
jgi:DNA-directed RNA polymerase subunit RPC12/RpoP